MAKKIHDIKKGKDQPRELKKEEMDQVVAGVYTRPRVAAKDACSGACGMHCGHINQTDASANAGYFSSED